MDDDPDQARLNALEKRINRAKGKDTPKRANTGTGFSQGEVAWRMVLELVTGMLLGLAIGYGLDVLFGTRPIFLILFALLGFAAGIKTMIGTAKQMAKDAEKSATDERD
ncbi:MAG: AtpZ/AtpI family protein [Cypionkella sp.]